MGPVIDVITKAGFGAARRKFAESVLEKLMLLANRFCVLTPLVISIGLITPDAKEEI